MTYTNTVVLVKIGKEANMISLVPDTFYKNVEENSDRRSLQCKVYIL